MKKLLEKPWAKALAFLLTLLPGTAAVYGGVELVYICVYNMHTDRRLDMLWAVTAVCAVAAAAALVFSLSAAGHWPGHEGIHLTWVEKIPVDLFVLGLTCVWYIYLDAVYYPSATLGLAVFVALAYLFVLAFTARCKAGTVLSDLLALRLLRLFSRGAVWAWRHLRVLVLSLPLTWKTAAVLVALMAAELLMLMGDLERLGDHAMNLLESGEELRDRKIELPPEDRRQLRVVTEAVEEIADLALAAFRREDAAALGQVEALEQVIDGLRQRLRARRIRETQPGEGAMELSFVWSDVLTDLERAADHCCNIMECVADLSAGNRNLHASQLAVRQRDPAFDSRVRAYEQKYRI